MSIRERTIQQLYPVGALSARPLAMVGAVTATVYAIVMSALNASDIRSAPVAIIGLALVAAASFVVVRGSSSERAPLSARTAAAAILLVDAGAVAYALSSLGANRFARDDWGGVSIALVIAAIAAYRPPREVALAGALSSILIAFVTVITGSSFAFDSPSMVFIVIEVMPIVLTTVGTTTFVSVVIERVERWRRRARTAAAAAADEAWIARSVQQDHVTVLNREAIPYLSRVLAAGELTEADVAEARAIADELRRSVVAGVDRSWVGALVQEVAARTGVIGIRPDAISDPDRTTDRIPYDQRSAVRAALTGVFSHPDLDPAAFSITAVTRGDRCWMTVTSVLHDRPEKLVRHDFAPYHAVLRVLLPDLVVEWDLPRLTVRFSYAC